MLALTPVNLNAIAVVGANCSDIAVGAGATLMEIASDKPDLVVHALVLTGGATEREVEEKNAFITLCPSADVRLTVADLPAGELGTNHRWAKQILADFRRDCEPDIVLGPHTGDGEKDREVLADLIPTAFSEHLILGYEILTPDSDLLNLSLYLPIPTETAHEKARLIAQCYLSQSRRRWFDDEAFLALMRVRGVQCNARYAEAFAVEKAASGSGVRRMSEDGEKGTDRGGFE
ncbi:PIG-L deacetylase family protein [Mycobacterium paraterrae]|uniref:PIG-L family deacetylase n=1 Tax=Mycobacterium paraterrae TaxID=577492 RepID=A0ABY3VMN5_9MYCO|nr:PIG-L family deacetylase [Mycobacterium paraterrae]UMB70694.1 PIG-L family deacetylase [Mycobacterium paraterrae]